MAFMPVASLIIGGIGTAVSALGAFSNAKAQAAQAQYQSEVAANNAKIAGYNAALEGEKGSADVARQGALNRARLGAESAQEAALGTDVQSGSNIDVRTSERMTGVQDLATLSRNASLNAYGYQNQGRGYAGTAAAEHVASENANASALPAAAGSLLEGASSLANKWTTFQNNGALGGSSSSSGGGSSGGSGGSMGASP